MKIFNDKKIILYIVSLLIIFSCESINNEETKTSLNNEDINLLSKSNLLNENTNIESNIFWISGKGTVKQEQEIIEINISIEHRDKDIINASKIVNENINKVVDIAKSLGISEKDIFTKKFNISPVERWIKKKDDYGEWSESEIIAYEVSNSISLTSNEITIITELINQSTIQTGNTIRISDINFLPKDKEENKIEARERAIEDAQYKASFYEKRLGINLGNIIYFEELSDSSLSQNKNIPLMRMSTESMPSASIYSGQSDIISELYLGFEILK